MLLPFLPPDHFPFANLTSAQFRLFENQDETFRVCPQTVLHCVSFGWQSIKVVGEPAQNDRNACESGLKIIWKE
jgi:hypothetical protein